MSIKENIELLWAKLTKWTVEDVTHQVFKSFIKCIIPTSLIPAFTGWIINPAKSLLAMVLVTAPLTIVISLIVIVWIQDKENRYNIFYWAIIAFPCFAILVISGAVLQLIGLQPAVFQVKLPPNLIYGFWDTIDNYIPKQLSFINWPLAIILGPLGLLYMMVSFYAVLYGWSLLFSLIVGVSAGWICSRALESYANPLFVKIAELNKAYPYDLLKKKGRLKDDRGGVAVTLSFGKKSGKVSVKDADGKKIPFDLVKKEELSSETEIYTVK